MWTNLRGYWNDYHQLCLLTTIVMGLLALILLFTPGVVSWFFNFDRTVGSDIMSGRAAMIFLGFSVITFRARNELISPLRRSLSLGVVVTMSGLFLVGLYDYLLGSVGVGIFGAMAVELYLATAFFRFWMQRG